MRIVLGLTFLVAACGATHPATPPAAAPAPAIEARLDALVTRTVEKAPLLDLQVAVVKDGKPLLLRAYGSADVAKQVPLALDTTMEVGSVTKQFTAVAALQLVDAKKLRLDDPVAKYVPGIATNITIADLLHQTSGLVDFAEPENLGKSSGELLAAIVAKAPTFAPGTRWEYCNSNYFLLGHIVEEVSGQSYGAYLQEHVLAPVGLTATHVCSDTDRTAGTVAQDGKLRAGEAFAPAFYGGAGALCSTVGELLRWQDALHGGKLLSPASLAFMTTAATLADGSASPYAAGILPDRFVGHRRLWHNGAVPDNAEAELDFYPDDHLQVVLLSRTISYPPGKTLGKLAGALAAQVILHDAPDAALAARIVGAYSDGARTVRVRLTDDDGLHIVLPGDEDSKLLYVTGSDFVLAVNPYTTYRFDGAAGAVEVIVGSKVGAKLERRPAQ